jgi:hypothetical protein
VESRGVSFVGESQWQVLKQYVCQHEDEFQPALDVWAFVAAYDRLLKRS